MSYEVGSPRCARKVLQNPERSVFQDENLLYVQPTKARSVQYNRPFKTPSEKIDADTTYGLSYKKYNSEYESPKLRIDFGKHEKIIRNIRGKFDFDTVYKLSYHADSDRKVRKPFVQKACLSINGTHDMTSTHKLSYAHPGHVKTASFKPHEARFRHTTPMECKTVTKESYQNFDIPKLKRPLKREFWQTKFKTDYKTTNHLSYQYVKPFSQRSRVLYKPNITAQTEKDTVYRTSYLIPGHFIPKDAITSA